MQAHYWIMRHASAGKTTDAKDDDKRPLDAEGRAQSKAAGIALKRLKTPIQNCLSSPLVRARETAELVCKELDLEVRIEPALYGPPVDNETLKGICRGLGNCLLVSHAPSVNLIVYRLTGAQVQLAKGGLAQTHEGEVWTLLNPSTCMVMAGMADFDDPQDVDHRSDDRPLIERVKVLEEAETPRRRSLRRPPIRAFEGRL